MLFPGVRLNSRGRFRGRIDEPNFGSVATTRRRYGAGYREWAEDRLALLELVELTGRDEKDLATTVRDVLQCWELEAERTVILGDDLYADGTIREVHTIERILEAPDPVLRRAG